MGLVHYEYKLSYKYFQKTNWFQENH